MGSSSPDDVTGWLQAWSRGDESALEELVPLVYQELRRRARCLMGRERAGHSLRPTALIHETYLRLVGSKPVSWRDRSHFSQTVLRDWRLARAWLSREMRRGDRNGRRPLEDG
jgi:DNA-directed RNA polymerase specialized sigma24 family protein